MNIATIIAQLKASVGALNGNVAGAADFASGIESTVSLPMPAAFVFPVQYEAGENEDWPGLRQSLSWRIAVVVMFDNTVSTDADRRTGFAGVNQVPEMLTALWAALLDWLPPDEVGRAARGFSDGGGRMVDWDRARLFWQFEFVLDTLITDADGYQIKGDTPITATATITVPGTPGGAPAIDAVIPSPNP